MSSRKGRMLPSNLSRSQPFSRLPLAAKVLYPLLIANADDQGRLSADPQTLKWNVCPNVQEITVGKISLLLDAMETQGMVSVYQDDIQPVLQLRLWWDDQSSMQWAYASDYLPPDGWNDRLRFRKDGRVITINWLDKANGAPGTPLPELSSILSTPKSLNIAVLNALGRPLPESPSDGQEETSAPQRSGTFRA